ncbi:hypothetical protein [Mangrovibacterium marinum]|uniref:hypothetical protein n=1 Tax=Mangrovibacterium marinum TaxID=1639118 RepID=UPI001472CE6E|nr:hypothetical protein [Mangrovibacterium marinum]
MFFLKVAPGDAIFNRIGNALNVDSAPIKNHDSFGGKLALVGVVPNATAFSISTFD